MIQMTSVSQMRLDVVRVTVERMCSAGERFNVAGGGKRAR